MLGKQFNYISKESMLSLNMTRFIQVNSLQGDKKTLFLFNRFPSQQTQTLNMVPNSIQDLKNLLFNSFISEIFLGVSDSSDPDVIFYDFVPKEKTKYFTVANITVKLNSSKNDDFSILHLNTRRLNKTLKV